MKSFIFTLVIALFSAKIASAATVTQQASVFSSATSNSVQVEVLSKDSTIEVTGEHVGGDSVYWLPVKTPSGKTGYIREKFVVIETASGESESPENPFFSQINLPEKRFHIQTSPVGDLAKSYNAQFSVGFLKEFALGIKATALESSGKKVYAPGRSYEIGPRFSYYPNFLGNSRNFGTGLVAHFSYLKSRMQHDSAVSGFGDALGTAFGVTGTTDRTESEGWVPEALVGFIFRSPTGITLECLGGLNDTKVHYYRYDVATGQRLTEYQASQSRHDMLVELNVGFVF